MHQLDRSHCIQMWEDQYDYIPTQEPIIVPELACVSEYMPWFRIYGKLYLLSPKERQRLIKEAQKFTRPIISAHNFIRPSNNTDIVTQLSRSTDDTHGTAFSDDANGLPMYRPSSYEGSQEGLLGSSFFYQTPSPYGFQTPSPLVMQTPPHSLFYQGGLSSQHRQPDPLPDEPESPPEQPQPPLEAGQRRNLARNRR
ncbi:hypothetical protein Gotur_036094 [Gossypium turneri]